MLTARVNCRNPRGACFLQLVHCQAFKPTALEKHNSKQARRGNDFKGPDAGNFGRIVSQTWALVLDFRVAGDSLRTAFTRALTCLSKYGDDLAIYATPDTLSLSATNSSMSAYCRFKCNRKFFVKYSVGAPRQQVRGSSFSDDVEEVATVTGQLLTKVCFDLTVHIWVFPHELYVLHMCQSLLSILKHRTVEKTVDRCELSIVEGASDQNEEPDEERDAFESKLIVRLHCKHG